MRLNAKVVRSVDTADIWITVEPQDDFELYWVLFWNALSTKPLPCMATIGKRRWKRLTGTELPLFCTTDYTNPRECNLAKRTVLGCSNEHMTSYCSPSNCNILFCIWLTLFSSHTRLLSTSNIFGLYWIFYETLVVLLSISRSATSARFSSIILRRN